MRIYRQHGATRSAFTFGEEVEVDIVTDEEGRYPGEDEPLVLVSEAREELTRELAAIWDRIPPIRHQVDAAMVFSAGEDIRELVNRLFPRR